MQGSNFGNIGPYQLLGELGRGAMARVWRAFDPNLEREVAIKEPLFDEQLSETVLEEMGRRFVKEGRAAGKLDHPNIVTIYAADVYNGRPAIVMELVEGSTLRDVLAEGPLSPVQTFNILDQLLDALGYAHNHGIVHRDIKPDNIFINTDGRVKLADFGIAHVEDSTSTHSTRVGMVLGTPGYMSPEQATGKPVDGRSDLFSVGTVAYEMLTGANPFGAGSGIDATTLIYRIVHEPVAELPEAASAGLALDMRPALMAALAKDPQYRPQTASAFRAMLHGSMKAPEVQQTVAMPIYSTEPSMNTAQSSNLQWVPYVVLAALALLVLFFIFTNATAGSGGGSGGSATQSSSELNSGQTTDTSAPANTDNAAEKTASEQAANKDTSEAGTKKASNLLGTWTILSSTEEDANGNTLTAETIAATNYQCTLEIRDDGSWALNENGNIIQGEWNLVGADTIEMTVTGEQVNPVGVRNGNVLTLTMPTGTVSFRPADTSTNISEQSAAESVKPDKQMAEPQSFWGVWVAAYEDQSSAIVAADELANKGFDARVYLTSSWSGLNEEPYYAVTAGAYDLEADAQATLLLVQAAGYSNAYIKNSGEPRS